MSEKNYGLFSSQRNRFMVIGNDYETLKYLQLLTIRHELLYLISLDDIENYRAGLLKKENCMKVGVTTGEKMRIEIDMYFTNPSYKLFPVSSSPTDSDYQYQEKLYTLLAVIESLFTLQRKQRAKYHKLIGQQIEGLKAFAKFVKYIHPDDQDIFDLINTEIKNKDQLNKILEKFTSELFNILYLVDLTQTRDDLVEDVKQKISRIPIKSHYYRISIDELVKEIK